MRHQSYTPLVPAPAPAAPAPAADPYSAFGSITACTAFHQWQVQQQQAAAQATAQAAAQAPPPHVDINGVPRVIPPVVPYVAGAVQLPPLPLRNIKENNIFIVIDDICDDI
jgi:hypothetical protein